MVRTLCFYCRGHAWVQSLVREPRSHKPYGEKRKYVVTVPPGDSEVKNPPASAGDSGSIPESGRSPREGFWQPTSVVSPGKFHGQRSLVVYCLWGPKESDMTK